MVILPATGRAQAERVADDLRGAIAEHPLAHGETLQMSFGAAVFPEDGATQDELLRVADGALLRAKAAKRSALGAL